MVSCRNLSERVEVNFPLGEGDIELWNLGSVFSLRDSQQEARCIDQRYGTFGTYITVRSIMFLDSCCCISSLGASYYPYLR